MDKRVSVALHIVFLFVRVHAQTREIVIEITLSNNEIYVSPSQNVNSPAFAGCDEDTDQSF